MCSCTINIFIKYTKLCEIKNQCQRTWKSFSHINWKWDNAVFLVWIEMFLLLIYLYNCWFSSSICFIQICTSRCVIFMLFYFLKKILFNIAEYSKYYSFKANLLCNCIILVLQIFVLWYIISICGGWGRTKLSVNTNIKIIDMSDIFGICMKIRFYNIYYFWLCWYSRKW